MLESLRVRLLGWYTLILLLIISLFGTAVCALYRRSLLRDVDRDLHGRAEVIAKALRPASGAFDLDLPDEASESFHSSDPDRPYYAIWDAGGNPIDTSDPTVRIAPPVGPGVRTRANVRETILRGPGGSLLVVGRPLTDVDRRVWGLAWSLVGVGALALVISLAGGWFLAGRALAPVARISRTAAEMSGGNLSARIPVDRTENELGQLAVALNQAFDRLQETLEKQRRFTADASHELRTPLATSVAEIEWALGRNRKAEEYRQSLETCQRSILRMRTIVEGLLTLARADAGELALQRSPVSLAAVVEDAVTLLRPMAERRRIAIDVRTDDVSVEGDPDRLRELVTALVSNAIHYNRDGGRIEVSVSAAADGVRMQVIDTGQGIAPADLPRVFDRFYRADPARGRNPGGAGLGLAVAKRIAESHGGEITCRSEPGQGTEIDVRLPAL
jgi:two-component system OmpR family sensor kinase